ncbi:hypothetical protein R1sor_025146 [Riccia sorocarpa]|uniref:Uncharacterized protein n=1 Tax=Riccia sorocarpa TaxID=122646 RepID=A0ABD3G7S0_9MARC
MTERLVGRPAGSTSHFGEAYIGSPISSMHDSWRMRIDHGLELRWKNPQRYGSSTTTLFSSSVKSEKLGNIELQAGGARCNDDLGLEEGEFDPRAGEAGNDFGARDGEWEGLRAGRDERNDVLGLEEGEYDPRDGEEGLVSRDRDLGFEEGVYDSRDHEGVFDVSDRDRGGEKFGKDELQVNRDERNVQFGLEEGKCVESETEEIEGPDRFDIDRVLVEELTPNRGVRFLKEWPSVEKAKPPRDYISNPTVECIHVENFPFQDCVDILPWTSFSTPDV